jgi:hypothetical protein
VTVPHTIAYRVVDRPDVVIDEIVASCNGDMRGAIKALLLVNEQLESELNHFYDAAAYGAPTKRAAQKKIAALTLAAASADMRDLGAVFDHDEPLPHPALLVRREPTMHARVHRIARNSRP